MNEDRGNRPLLTLLNGDGDNRDEILAEARDYMREVAMTLRATDPWRDALLTFATELTCSLPAPPAWQQRHAQPRASR